MTALADFEKDIALFVEAGLIAIKQGDEESASKLFKAVALINPEHETVELGPGLIALHKMELIKAQSHFKKLLSGKEKNWRAQAFLALTYVLSILQLEQDEEKLKHLQEGYSLAQEVLEKCEDSSTRELAQSVMDWEKEMQKKGK